MNIKYIYDPICGWCYGSLPSLKKIASDENFELEILPSGMFAKESALNINNEFADYIWKTCLRIESMTSQHFGKAFKNDILLRLDKLDSYLPTLALVAVKWLEYDLLKEIRVLDILQTNINVKGIDITNSLTLIELLKKEGLQDIATLIEKNDPNLIEYYESLVSKTKHLMRKHYITGIPALLRNDKLIDNGILYLKPENTINGIKN